MRPNLALSKSLTASEPVQPPPHGRAGLASWTPHLVIAPSAIASFVYVFVFTAWTLYVSMSNSTLLPTYEFVGLKPYFELWSNQRWAIAYGNLFLFSAIYVLVALAIGLALAIAIDQRVKGEAVWRTIFLYPLAVSFIVTGTVWSWLYSPNAGIEFLVRNLGWHDFTFRLTTSKTTAIYAIIATGVWQSSGFAMALFLAGLRSVDPDLIKAAQIDGAGPLRLYRRVILPTLWPITVTVVVIQLQFAISTFDLVRALTNGGPGIATQLPALVVYDLMFQRSLLGRGAAAAVLMLLILLAVLLPYAAWRYVQRRRATHA